MLGLRRALVALFALGIVFAGFLVGLVVTSDHEEMKVATAIVAPIVGLAFISTGVFAWWRRPLNRFGLLMTSVGFAYFLAGVTESNNSTVFTIASYIAPLYLVLVIQMVLAFPSGRLETVGQRAIIAAGYLDVFLVRLPFFLLGGDVAAGLNDPRLHNVLAITDQPDLADIFDYTSTLTTVVLLLRKRRAATLPQRRALAPMLWTGMLLVGLLGVTFVLDAVGASESVVNGVGIVALVAFAVLPFAFLAGLVRSRYSRAGAVGQLIERLNNPEADRSLAQALADALGDRSLKLVYWRPSAGHYVTYDGRRVELPQPGSGRAVTEVEREGIRVGAIIHDASLADEPDLVRAVAASAALALENERLEAELRPRLDELQTSRARLVEVSIFERRRLERDLHDGAQQRLVALSLQLGLARRSLDSGDGRAATAMLDAARDELARA